MMDLSFHSPEATKQKSTTPLWKRIIRLLAFWIVSGIDVMGMILSVIGVLWMLIGDNNLLTWHFSSLMPGIIALSPLILILGIMKRRRWLLFHIVPAGLFILLYGVMFIPRAPIVASDTPQLRVMTFNTQFKFQAPEIMRVIQEANADVVALQELVQPTADYLAEHLADEYPYQITHINPDSLTQGKGILSRYPLLNERFLNNKNEVNYLRVQIEFEGEKVTIVTTHPTPPHWGTNYNAIGRSQHIDWIMDNLSQESGALIILGDFNTTDQSDDYRQITAHYHDSVREVGLGLGQTFPDSTSWQKFKFIPPLIRIDYVFHSDELTAVFAGAWHESAGSDHRPTVANLIWTPQS